MSSRLESQPGARLEVDRARCEGHAVCARTARSLLKLDQDGELVILVAHCEGEALERARAAARACPIAALRLV